MDRVLAAHQPNFLPWLGFWHKMATADVFVLLDCVQVSKNSYANRVKIKSPQGEQWLTLPMHRHGPATYHDVIVANGHAIKKLTKTLNYCYGKAPYFDYTYAGIEVALEDAEDCSLATINTGLIRWLRIVAGIGTPMILQSDIGILSDKETLIVDLCTQLEMTAYLSGQGAKSYNYPQQFEARGIELRYQKFKCPEYPQLWGEFIPNLSIIDLLFNCGPESLEILTNA